MQYSNRDMVGTTVAELMTRAVTVLGPRHHLKRAAEEMHLGRIRHLPIVDESGALIGILSERDLIAAGLDMDRSVAEVMHRDVLSVTPETPAHEAAYLLIRHPIGCVPVVDAHEKLVGIVTDTDFLRVAYIALGGVVSVDQLETEEREADKV